MTAEKLPYHRVDQYEDGATIDWDETYDMLVGPDGFECLLTEPEDRNWFRDGRAAVARLNVQHSEIAELNAEVEWLRKRHAEIVEALYGQRLYVVGWHLNGDYESLDNFFENNDWLKETP